jgi:carboxylate-amine ligase
MAKLEFNSNRYPTLGVELELALVSAESLELSNSIDQVLEHLSSDLGDRAKPELMQCCLEINTGICRSVDQAADDLAQSLRVVERVTDSLGLLLWWGATHPSSLCQHQKVTPDPRYYKLVNLLQEMARRLITFGLHVHVGVDSGDKAVMICDRIMQHLPTLLALSCSSPYWEGQDTGLHSHRSKIMEVLPTAGLPTLMRNWSEYSWLVNHLVDTGFINTIREIWWDVRPHHNFGTVEVRVCDMPGSLDRVLAITALIQCLVKALSDEIDEGTYQHDCHPMMVRQNKWRACRFGNRAHLVDAYTCEVRTVSEVTGRLIERLTPTARNLECESHLQKVQALADGPAWSDRQRAIQKQSGDASEVLRRLISESRISPPAERSP